MTMKQSQEGDTIVDLAGADQALVMAESAAAAFEAAGGELSGMSRDALARDLAAMLEPLLTTCTRAECIEAINARLVRLEGQTDKPGPRLERFAPDGIAEIAA